ncbi:MAG: hypothetical protein WCC03_13525 [Candidatus Acidiferrales bacterium]
MPSATLAPASSSPATSTSAPSRTAAPPPRATDDEILGITSPRKNPPRNTQQLEFDFDAADSSHDVIPSEASALSASGPAQPGRADAQSRNLSSNDRADSPAAHTSIPEPAHLRATFDANPELRAAWRDASAYRESFATPDAARQATALLADVNHMDALFFSRRPEDHAALARSIANLDPAAFASLADAMQTIAANADASRTAGLRPAPLPSANENQLQIPRSARNDNVSGDANANPHAAGATNADATGVSYRRPPAGAFDFVIPSEASALSSSGPAQQVRADAQSRNLSSAAHVQSAANSAANESQLAFLHAANAAAVEGVVAAIEAQVERLLPEGVAKNARTRVVGEIYRELDSSLRSNPQFAAQLRDAFRSGSLDDGHQRAIVSLLTGRARQALPGVAKRVLSEWTSTIMSAANERRTRQRTAERRIDIAGSSGAGNDGRKSMSPRDLDYTRLSDADILNL